MADWNKLNNRGKAAVFDWYQTPHNLKVRASKPREDHPDLEKYVIRAVSQLLAVHPKVLFGVRQNSGGASYEHSSGAYKPIHFYQILTSQPVTITDFWGILRDGRPFCLEAKRPSWKEPSNDREMRQALFISLIQNCGGVGGFVRSADQANEVLNG